MIELANEVPVLYSTSKESVPALDCFPWLSTNLDSFSSYFWRDCVPVCS